MSSAWSTSSSVPAASPPPSLSRFPSSRTLAFSPSRAFTRAYISGHAHTRPCLVYALLTCARLPCSFSLSPRPSPRARSPRGRPQSSTASLPSRRADLPLRRRPGVATARALRLGCVVEAPISREEEQEAQEESPFFSLEGERKGRAESGVFLAEMKIGRVISELD